MNHVSEQGKAALIKVAEWLEAGAPHVVIKDGVEVGVFDMTQVVNIKPECGTACCIAGSVCQFNMLGMDVRYDNGNLGWDDKEVWDPALGEYRVTQKGGKTLAQEYLGMNEGQADELFEPWNHFTDPSGDNFSDPALAAKTMPNVSWTWLVA